MGRLIYDLTMTRRFRDGLQALPGEDVKRVMAKAELLETNPHPDGSNVKLKIHGRSDCYRLRAGNYRVIYSIMPDAVSLLHVDGRADVYDALNNLVVPDRAAGAGAGREPLDWLDGSSDPQNAEPKPRDVDSELGLSAAPAVDASDDLPKPITMALLHRLQIPSKYRQGLCACRTVTDLTTISGVPPLLIEKVFNVLAEPDLDRLPEEPQYVVQDFQQLVRYTEGELVPFLLRLDPEQEQAATWAVSASGPTLLKGGPGTGKSVIALYRVRRLIEALRKEGMPQPQILYATYTKALVTVSQQLLRSLLGQDSACVQVVTVDQLAHHLLRVAGVTPRMADRGAMIGYIRDAVANANLSGPVDTHDVKRSLLVRISPEYLLEEFESVIEARQIRDLVTYLAAARAGRSVPLPQLAREAVWDIYEEVKARRERQGLMTYGEVRNRAAIYVRDHPDFDRFDAVVIDEAQDLDPTALRLLASLSKRANGVFITADANQSIYGNSFRWADVHDELRFTGRTRILRTNYRSTAEIGAAASSFLATSALDPDQESVRYVRHDRVPEVVLASTAAEELAGVQRFFRMATEYNRLGIGTCAVLVPAIESGKRIAAALTARGLEAQYLSRDDVDLDAACIKVITLQSSKGLEFPIVAIAGFVEHPNPGMPKTADEYDEWLYKQRRIAYVGMTRAMRALLVVVPGTKSRVLSGFDKAYWNWPAGS